MAGGRAVLCGHSSGCTISLAAADRGLAVNGLALWEAPIGGTVGGVGPWVAEVERRIDAGDLEGALVHYMKDMPPEWLEEARHDPGFPEYVAQVVSYVADGESLVWAESAASPSGGRDPRAGAGDGGGADVRRDPLGGRCPRRGHSRRPRARHARRRPHVGARADGG